jgi:hypothetical protein
MTCLIGKSCDGSLRSCKKEPPPIPIPAIAVEVASIAEVVVLESIPMVAATDQVWELERSFNKVQQVKG